MTKWFGSLTIFLGIVILFLAFSTFYVVDYEGGEVDCFDEFNNRIIGLTCYEEPTTPYDLIPPVLVLSFIGIIFITLGVISWDVEWL